MKNENNNEYLYKKNQLNTVDDNLQNNQNNSTTELSIQTIRKNKLHFKNELK